MPVPPLAEQKRIVTKLDNLFAHTRRAHQELDHIPKLIERYKQAILSAAFRGDLTADWRKENNSLSMLYMDNKELINAKVEELSILPEKWAWINISSVAKVTGGLTKNQSKMKLEKIVPYLRVANVYANEIRLDEVLEIGINESEWKRVKLEKEDLLIVEGNGSLEQVGRVAIWNGEIENCAHQNHLIKIRFDELVIPKFALYWLLSLDGRRAIMQLASSSSGLHTLSMSKVSSLPMPLCSVKEMNIIVEIIETLFKKIDRLEQEYQKAMKFLDRLEQSTLAKAFRGEIVPQDPNDEPASILLERIQKERENQQTPKKRQLSLFKEKT